MYYPVALGHHPFRIYVAAVEVLRHHLPQRRLLTVGVEVLALWVGGNEAVPLTWRGQQRPRGACPALGKPGPILRVQWLEPAPWVPSTSLRSTGPSSHLFLPR